MRPLQDTFNGWWDGLGDPRLNDEVIQQLVDGIAEATSGQSPAELSAKRDKMLTAMQKATRDLRS